MIFFCRIYSRQKPGFRWVDGRHVQVAPTFALLFFAPCKDIQISKISSVPKQRSIHWRGRPNPEQFEHCKLS